MNLYQRTTALVVDDQPVYRNGILRILNNIQQVDSHIAEHPDVVLEKLEKNKPHFVFLEIQMTMMNGLEIADWIRKTYPDIKLVVISSANQKKQVVEVLQKGVCGYISKTAGESEISQAIQTIIAGSLYYTPDISAIWSEHLIKQSTNGNTRVNHKTDITLREKEIIRLICKEMTTSEIATHLNISFTTVNNHRAHIMKKLKIESVVGVVLFALRTGIYIP